MRRTRDGDPLDVTIHRHDGSTQKHRVMFVEDFYVGDGILIVNGISYPVAEIKCLQTRFEKRLFWRWYRYHEGIISFSPKDEGE